MRTYDSFHGSVKNSDRPRELKRQTERAGERERER